MEGTSLSLLERIRKGEQAEAWDELVAVYQPVLRGWLLRFRVPPADADDLMQEVLSVLVRELPDFRHSGNAGAFRSWLRTTLFHRVQEYRRRLQRSGRPLPENGEGEEDLARHDDTLARQWDAEHDQQVVARLMALVQPRFEPNTWEAFRRQVIHGESPRQIAASLGMSVGAVYMARNRVLHALRQAGDGLVDTD